MGLSYDIISEFVKITNDNKEKPKEGTVYATVVSSSGGKYVKIDGSDLLTPMDTTADIEDGERVTLTIKDHKAIVTGNVTSPSASTSKVDKVTETVSSLSDRVGTFELVVADKISTKELEAYKATIEVLIAQKASIENLNATNAEIDKLKAKDAQIENLVADKATISDLQAVNATIENLKAKDVEIENAVIDNLEATTADIRILSSDFAQIKTLVNGNLTSDNILSFNITSEKVTMEDAFIKDAMIDTISAGKINAGKINTNSVSIGSEDGAMTINGSTQQFRDKNGNVRIQIGQDASGDFTFILYGEDGTGQLINQNGITASAIGSGLIVNDMVSDNAAIAGGKLDISSVITEINNDNSTTIKSNKIYLNEQEQSLEVAFNSLKTKVDTIQEVTIDGDLAAVTEQVQSNTTQIAINKESINSLVSEDTVLKKQVSDLNDNIISTEETLTAKYTTLEQNLEGFQTNVADTYATKASVNDVNNNLSKNYSTTTTMNSAIAQKASEITASVASTYATKNEVKTLNDNLEANYSTTEQMESAIAVAKEEIDLSVSSIYETKTESTTKVNKAKADAISAASTDASTKANKAKADAISAASTDATSKVNAAKTELNTAINKKANSADVYTKTETYTKAETDSKIKIAKDAIDLSVSTTYETKTNVEDKITDALTTAASDATTKANNAKTAAISAASTDATSKVNAAKTELNTAINKKANSADVYTKTETYTKAETDSKINIAKDAINLSVSNTYETKENTTSKINSAISGIQVGATNRLYGTAVSKNTNIDSPSGYVVYDVYTTPDKKTLEELGFKDGDKVTVSLDWTISQNGSNDYVYGNFRIEFCGINSNGTDNQFVGVIKNPADTFSSSNTNGHVEATVTLNATSLKAHTLRIRIDNSVLNFKIANAKLEKGTKATQWSPAPEDITKAISDIQVGGTNLWVVSDTTNGYEANGSINSSTSQHKIRQTIIPLNGAQSIVYQCWNPNRLTNSSNTNRVAFYNADSNYISSTALPQLNGDTYQCLVITVPSNAIYIRLAAICGTTSGYDTSVKIKFELGNKPTDYSIAPEDVQSSIDAKASSSDVYTKEQTDSKINIAKDAINLSVSNTYETKANVETKTTTVLNSAKSYADTKKTEAINTAASDATTKANNAKTAAISAASTDASTKANKAKADAISAASTDATSKVNAAKTELNTAINKKANSADVYTKTETYTKAETDSKIKIAKDAIDLSVSTLQTTVTNHTTQINNKADLSVVNQKIDGIQVGGRNLILNSALKGNKNWINVSIDTTKTYEGCNSIKFTGLNSSYSNYISAKKGDIVTISAKTFIEKNSGNLPLIIIEEYRDNSDERINYQETTVSSTINSWQKYEKTWTIKNSETTRIRVRFYNRQPSFNYWTSQPKLEKGTKATDWSPAPEDIQSSIDTKANITDVYKKTETYTKSETDSKIKVAKDAIDLSVSQTYETKTNVESKVTSTLNSAKSYADTKKTEAINTAASDATNKINNINIGGVNRLIGTDEPKTRNINNPSNYDVWDTYFTPNKQSLKELGFKLGDQITLGFNWNISKNGSNDFVYGNCRAEMAGYKEGTEAIEYIGIIKTPIVTFSSSNTSGRAEATVTLTENKNLNMNTLRIRIDNSVLALTISDVKLEKGNKATSWSPAPEDVDSDITSLESETSSIKQTVTSLQLGTDNINATVKSLSETLTSSNQNLAADIASVQNQVNMAMTADQVKMEIKKELVNGVNKVTTSTGYVFDQNGLSISKSGSEMETKITEDGMKVFKNDEVMLTANNQGVDAKNLHATTYLIIGGNSRMEDFKHGTEKRTAVFWIG